MSGKKGQIPWNKGRTGVYSNITLKKMRKPKSPETIIKMRDRMKGNKIAFGKHHSISADHRKKLSGSNCHFWKGGITPQNIKIRQSLEYKLWRKSILERDSHTCKMCGIVSREMHAHHLWEFSRFPELRFAINNGITLCRECHKKVHSKKKNMRG